MRKVAQIDAAPGGRVQLNRAAREFTARAGGPVPDGRRGAGRRGPGRPVRRDELLPLLHEGHPVYDGRGESVALRTRGWVMAAYETVGLPDEARAGRAGDAADRTRPVQRRCGGPRRARCRPPRPGPGRALAARWSGCAAATTASRSPGCGRVAGPGVHHGADRGAAHAAGTRSRCPLRAPRPARGPAAARRHVEPDVRDVLDDAIRPPPGRRCRSAWLRRRRTSPRLPAGRQEVGASSSRTRPARGRRSTSTSAAAVTWSRSSTPDAATRRSAPRP